ncbi:uncharacterized protein METZ01_LOCUS176040, partial [marine metagenome]
DRKSVHISTQCNNWSFAEFDLTDNTCFTDLGL